jgi:outer membrane protein
MKTFLKIAAIAVLLSSTTVKAEKIAVVNIDTIVSKAKATVALKSQVDNRKKELQISLKSKEQFLTKERDGIRAQQKTLSKEALGKKVKELQDGIVAARKDVAQKQANLQTSFITALKQVDAATGEVIEGIAKERGYTLVLPKKTVLYYSGSDDVTDLVLKRLDEKLKTVTLK